MISHALLALLDEEWYRKQLGAMTRRYNRRNGVVVRRTVKAVPLPRTNPTIIPKSKRRRR